MDVEARTPIRTVIVNVMGGPGTGKSTHVAGAFGLSKSRGILCEMTPEYAKDRTYETEPILYQEDLERTEEIEEEREISLALQCQPYVAGKQLWRQFRVLHKVQLVYTDTSLLLSGYIYKGFGSTESFEKAVLEQFEQFENCCIFLERDEDKHPYQRRGRSQTKEEAIRIDHKVREVLDNLGLPYKVIKVGEYFETITKIADYAEACYKYPLIKVGVKTFKLTPPIMEYPT